MRPRHLAILALVVAALAAPAGHAVEPGEILKDPALEARARDISRNLRCLVCQNQSIDDSNADLARDLRKLVRRRLTEGDSDADVIEFVTARYGDFVLLRPPFKPATYILWFGPALIFVAGVAGIVLALRRRRLAPAGGAPPLSAEERRRIADLMDGGHDA